MEFSHQDRIVVTGATSGIGKACALHLNTLGASVIAVGRNNAKLDELKNIAASPEHMYIVEKDLIAGIDTLDKWVIEMRNKYGRLSGMLLAAGIRHTVPLKGIVYESMKSLFDINVFSNVMLIKGFCHPKVNIGRGSAITVISSIAAKTGGKGVVSYSSSKAALIAIVKSVAQEFIMSGIRINAVLPGYVETSMLTGDKNLYNDNFVEMVKKNYPLGLGKPEDIAQLAIFLLSNSSSWITGSNFMIDGGATLGR